MPHVTFIHGIGNKPDSDVLLRIWRRGLAHDLGLDLGAEGVTSSMVYWADVLYEKSEEEAAAHENTDTILNRDYQDIDVLWGEGVEGEEKIWVDQLTSRLNFNAPGDDDSEPPESEIGPEFERVPLPWWLKRRLMKTLLRDVHHYLFNSEHSPREGESYRVQDEIRNRMIEALKEGEAREGPHVVVSHSMGTVIAYDCLKRVTECPRVDALVTIGSPLGIDEVQDKLKPEWTREEGYPGARLAGAWINVYDRFDPVSGLDPQVSDDYQRGRQQIVEDINEQNYGRWRHNITKYLGGPILRARLRQLLSL